jgi:hypothetical protein
VIFVGYNLRRRKCGMWLPNTISIIGDSETMCSKSRNNCPSLFCHTCSYTIYTFHVLCNILIVSVMNSGHLNYLHYAVYFYNCVGFLQIALGRRGCHLTVKKLLFGMMVIISARLSMEHLGCDVI